MLPWAYLEESFGERSGEGRAGRQLCGDDERAGVLLGGGGGRQASLQAGACTRSHFCSN
jgi:hypothetical protein